LDQKTAFRCGTHVPVILFLHHRYRAPGGEERAVAELARVVREHLDEPADLLQRDSARISARTAAAGLVGGGLRSADVGVAVRGSGARIVHAHNLHPTLGWRALAAARAAGARVVLHLHQYRLVCATGVCFRDGAECTECHGTNTLPGVRHNCRGSRAEALTYAAALALWQRRLLAQADAIAVPSAFAAARLRELGAPVGEPFVVPNPVRALDEPAPARSGPGAGALVVSRLAPEKGVDLAIEACARAGLALTIAGDGPERAALERQAGAVDSEVRFTGRVGVAELRALREAAAVAVVPSRAAETFGLAAAEAMAAGLPVAATRVGALPELVPAQWLADPRDPEALAAVIVRLATDPPAPEATVAHARRVAAPAVVADRLRTLYDSAVS
jgi:glycosyltransferase involved in cell wall biosynthesis